MSSSAALLTLDSLAGAAGGDHPAAQRIRDALRAVELEFAALLEENMSLRTQLGLGRGMPLHAAASGASAGEFADAARKAGTERSRKALGHIVEEYEGHRDGIWEVTCARGVLGSVSCDRTARVWPLPGNDAPVNVYVGHRGSVNSIRFQSTGAHVCTASGDGTCHIWAHGEGAPATMMKQASLSSNTDKDFLDEARREAKDNLSANGDDDELSDGVDDDTLRVITAPLLRVTHAPQSITAAADWLAGENMVVTCGWDKTVKMWDINTNGTLLHTWAGHSAKVTHLSSHMSAPCFVTASADQTAALWDSRYPMAKVGAIEGHTDTLNSAVYTPNGNFVVTSSDDKTVRVWDVKRLKTPVATVQCKDAANRVSVDASATRIAIPLDSRKVLVVTLHGDKIGVLKSAGDANHVHKRLVTSVAWHDSNKLYSASFDGQLLGWELTV